MEVFFVCAQVVSDLSDARLEDGDLHFWRACVSFGSGIFFDDFSFCNGMQWHLFSVGLVFIDGSEFTVLRSNDSDRRGYLSAALCKLLLGKRFQTTARKVAFASEMIPCCGWFGDGPGWGGVLLTGGLVCG